MKVIYKYPLEVTDSQTLQLPAGAQILGVIAQGEDLRPMLYALVSPPMDAPTKKHDEYDVLIIGTGNPIKADLTKHSYLGTVPVAQGRLVWHVLYKLLSAAGRGV